MQHLDKDPELVMEGRETADFWDALGGKVIASHDVTMFQMITLNTDKVWNF